MRRGKKTETMYLLQNGRFFQISLFSLETFKCRSIFSHIVALLLFPAIEELICDSTFEWESLRNYLKQIEMFVQCYCCRTP